MRVYKFIDQKWGLKSLAAETLKVSEFDKLNDPFELAAMSLETKEERDALRKSKSEYSKKYGVICFSSRWGNPVMWSHYAERHEGMVLEFEVPDQRLKIVEYSTRRLAKNMGHRKMDDLVKIKFSHWSYENEIRMVLPLKSCEKSREEIHTIPFSNSLKLKRIFLGHSYCPTNDSSLQEKLKGLDVEIVTARLAFTIFQVIPQKERTLWKEL